MIASNYTALVTIGIPFYNAEEFLPQAIRSVLNQTYSNWKLILLDDGSTDRSLEIANKFRDDRIEIISDGTNKGLVYRLNQLSNLAIGEYYARMDADDIMHFDRITTQVKYLCDHPDVDIVGTSYYTIDASNNLIGFYKCQYSPESINDILAHGCFAHPSVMGKSSWFKKNPYDPLSERMEDYELWLRTVNSSVFRNIDEPLLFYRNVGIPTLKKYLKSNNGILKLLFSSKKYHIDFFTMVKYIALFFLKNIIYVLFSSIGQIDFLINKRSMKISLDLIDEIKSDLQRTIK